MENLSFFLLLQLFSLILFFDESFEHELSTLSDQLLECLSIDNLIIMQFQALFTHFVSNAIDFSQKLGKGIVFLAI